MLRVGADIWFSFLPCIVRWGEGWKDLVCSVSLLLSFVFERKQSLLLLRHLFEHEGGDRIPFVLCCVGWLPQRCWCKLMCGGRSIKESDIMMGLSKNISTLWAQHISSGSFSCSGMWPVGAQLAPAPRHEALQSLFNVLPGCWGQLGSNFWVVKATVSLWSAAF